MKTALGVGIGAVLASAAAFGAAYFGQPTGSPHTGLPVVGGPEQNPVPMPKPTPTPTPNGAPTALDPSRIAPTVVGMNLGITPYWSAEWAFSDLVKLGTAVRYVDPKGGWPPATGRFRFDIGGHPIDIPRGTTLALTLQNNAARLPVGSYDCRMSDGWDLRPWGEWQMKGTPTHFTMTVPQPVSRQGIVLLVTSLRDHAGLTELSCLRQGPGNSGTFNPVFLNDTRPYKVVRFMDWMNTNNAPLRTWAARTTPASLTQAGSEGVSVEHMVELANTLGFSPWFNMPLDADPGYYKAFATYVRDHLDKRQKVYVELSNEVWNNAFKQGQAATARGRARYPGVDYAAANDYYYGDRVREVMKDWSDVFAGQTDRLVRIAAAQAVAPSRGENVLSHGDTWRSVDALAIAPYFGIKVYNLPGTGAARINAAFAAMPAAIDDSIRYARDQKKVAARYGLPLVTYEAGQHLLAYQPELAADLLAVNRDPRMYDAYQLYLGRWQREIGGLIVLFDSVLTPSLPGGQFGHRDYTGQPVAEAPKARAVEDFIRRQAP